MSGCICETPVGRLKLTAENGSLVSARLTDEPLCLSGDPLLQQATAQLNEYLAGQRTAFTVPLAPKGTPFQRRVWSALLTVPYGKTVSYGEIAARAGYPTAVRATGTAIGHNPLLIFIPCHRVIRGDGSIGGFTVGTAIKRRLLKIEEVTL